MPQKFRGKHQDRSLFFNKVDVCKLANQNHVRWEFVMLCAIWYHLHNLKREKRPWRSVNLLKVTLLRGRFSRFSYCTNVPNGAKHQILIHVYFHFAWRKCISTYFQLNHDKHTGKCALKVLTFEILKDK